MSNLGADDPGSRENGDAWEPGVLPRNASAMQKLEFLVGWRGGLDEHVDIADAADVRLSLASSGNSLKRVGPGCEYVLPDAVVGLGIPSASRRTSMRDRTGLSRGDRNRNSLLAQLRQVLPPDHAIVRYEPGCLRT